MYVDPSSLAPPAPGGSTSLQLRPDGLDWQSVMVPVRSMAPCDTMVAIGPAKGASIATRRRMNVNLYTCACAGLMGFRARTLAL